MLYNQAIIETELNKDTPDQELINELTTASEEIFIGMWLLEFVHIAVILFLDSRLCLDINLESATESPN